mgnify:CR=1 FL=1
MPLICAIPLIVFTVLVFLPNDLLDNREDKLRATEDRKRRTAERDKAIWLSRRPQS